MAKQSSPVRASRRLKFVLDSAGAPSRHSRSGSQSGGHGAWEILRIVPNESPTPDLVELTHRAFEAVNKRDLDTTMSLDAAGAGFDMTRTTGFDPRGRAAIREWTAGLSGVQRQTVLGRMYGLEGLDRSRQGQSSCAEF